MRTLITTIALFTGFAAAAQTVSNYHSVQNPGTMKTDSHGNLWINYRTTDLVDTYHLARIHTTGVMTDVITTTREIAYFGVNDSVIWIASPSVEKVYKYDHGGQLHDSVNVSTPAEILLDPDGTWYMAQSGPGRILRFTPDNMSLILASGLPLNENITLSRDENGIFYSCNRQNANMVRVDPVSGDKSTIAVLPDVMPYSVSSQTYRNGNLYVTSGLHCIYRVDTTGLDMVVFAGIEGTAGDVVGSAETALFDQPTGIAFSLTGDTLFVADAGNQKIKAITGMTALGQQELQAKRQLSVYPNPAEGIVHIAIDGEQPESLTVSDINGKIVDVPVLQFGTASEIDVSKLLKGMYFIDALAADGTHERKAFVRM